MKKRIVSLFLTICLLSSIITTFPIVVSAAASGKCGDNLTWTLDSNGTLTISGTGSMYGYKIPDWDGSNPAPWYDCKVKNVVIERGVTSIGKEAFGKCSYLTSITIPDSVTSIGYCAFYKCTSILSVTIPDSVTSIDKSAFLCCSALSDVVISSSITSISESMFNQCSSLTSITIPDSVTSIGERAFYGCTSLSNVIIPDSVTQIGIRAFGECSSLKKIIIPKSVTGLSACTFSSSGLTSIAIPKSVTWIDHNVFSYCNLTDIYYAGSATNWAGIKILSSNTYHLKNVKIHYNCTISGNNSSTKSDFAQIFYKGNTYNLLTQPISIDKDSSAEVSVKVNYANCTADDKIYLSQSAEKYIELENNVSKNIIPSDIFDTGKDIYVLIVNKETGKTLSSKTKLNIASKTTNITTGSSSGIGGLNFKLGGASKFTIPDNLPFFGGTEIKWDFGLIPVSVEYDRDDNNKINVVFGANIVHADNKGVHYFEDFNFKEYKESLKKAASKQNRTLKQLRHDFRISNACKMNLFGSKVVGGGTGKPSCDFDIAGYGEMKLINGEWRFIEGQICLEAEVSYTYQGQLFIWTVPLYYEIGGGIGAGYEGNIINIDPEKIFAPVFDESYLTARLTAKVGGGLGIAKVATIGALGEGSLNMKTALHKEYFKAWGEGEADFTVKVFGKEVAKKTFAKGDFLIYETGNANGLLKDKDIVTVGDENGSGGDSLSLADSPLYSTFNSISRSEIYENESRAYISNSTEWYGDMPPVSLFDAEYTSKNLRLLAENVYTESAPIVCDIGGQKVMVMLWDNSERDAINRTMLVYSVYDDSEDIWSAPLPVCDDGTADFYPSFNDGYLVWQNEKSLLDDSMSLGDIAKLGEICVSKWNGNGFDTPVVLTNNDTLDTQPVVCAYESEVSVIWTTNSENDILGLSGDNSIVKSSLIGSAWSEPTVVKKGLNTITNLSAGYTADGLNIAYVSDADNDLQTIDDRDICIISGRGEYKLTDNDVLDSNPQIKGDKIYYYSNGNIKYQVLGSEESNTVFADAKVGITDNFSVSESSNGGAVILWAKSTDGATEIFSTILNDGKWSDEIQISETGNQSKYPTAVLEDDGSIYIAYNNGILTDGEITQTDLYVIDLTPSYDLSVSDAYIDEDTMTVFATVKNSGELNIDSYTVSLIDNGVNVQMTVADGLKAGESAEVEIGYIKPSDLTKHTITLSVETENDEYNTDNNSAELIVGNCDIEITDIQNHETLPTSVAVATVSNRGYSDTGTVTVKLRKDKANGEVVDTQTISNISAGTSSEVTFNYNIIENDNIQWYITAEAENDEISLGNNDSYFINNCLSGLSDYSQKILRYDIVDEKLIVNGYAENNTAADLSGVSVLAVYNSASTLKSLTHGDTYVYKYDSTSVDLTVDDYTYETGDYIKLFFWTDLISIVPICEAEYSAVIKE